MLTNTRWRGAVAVLAAIITATTLVGCTNGDVTLPDLSGYKASQVDCATVDDVVKAFNNATSSTDDPNKLRAVRAAGVNPLDTFEVTTTKDALGTRALECALEKAAASPSPSPSPSLSPSPSPGPSTSASAPAVEQEAEVEDNGTRTLVPLVTTAPNDASVDTTGDPQTLPSLPVGLCPVLVDWSSLVNCVEDNNLQWFINDVNEREPSTGFNWSDIVSWTEATNAKTVEVRAIAVFGPDISNAEARSRAAVLVGKDTASRLPIVRHPACFVNTRGLKDEQMTDFVYCPPNSRQARVTLMPVLMKGGAITGIVNQDAGVFVDCDNVWWIPERISVPGREPQVEPTSSATPKVTPPTPKPGPSTKPSATPKVTPSPTPKAKNTAEAYVPSGDSDARGEDETTVAPSASEAAVPRSAPTATYIAPTTAAPTTTTPRATTPPPVESAAPTTVAPSPTVDPCSTNPDFCEG